MVGTVLHSREKKSGLTVTVGGFSYRTPCIHIMNTISNKIIPVNDIMIEAMRDVQPQK